MHFEISERKILLRILDISLVLLALFLLQELTTFHFFKLDLSNWIWTAVLIAYLFIFSTVFELYDLQKSDNFGIITKNIILTTSITVLVYILTPYYTPMLPANRMEIIFFFLTIMFALILSRFLYITLISSPRFYKRVLVIADSRDCEEICGFLEKSDPNYKVVAFYDTNNHKDSAFRNILGIPFLDLKELNDRIIEWRISEIVVAARTDGGITKELNKVLLSLMEKGMTIRDYVQVHEELIRRIPVKEVERDFYMYFPFSRSNNNKLYLLFSRIFDIVLSIIGIVGGILILPFVLIGNLFGNRGPLFYQQTRVGKNGKHFQVYKLRSMIVDAEKDGAQYAQKNDVRITKFGRFLRKSRLDEVPQFYNVLKGDMSIIGPRPKRPEFVCTLAEKIPFYEVRHVVKPGITGWAQVNARYGVDEDDALEKLQYDLYYIKHRSIFLDGSIIFKTLSTIVFFRGQ